MKRINKTEFIRVEKTKNYTVLHNHFLKRDDLSWKAKGMLAYILSLPNDWNINLEEIMRHATEGKSAFRSGWKELRDAGYVERRPVKDEETKKILYWETIVRETVEEEAAAAKKPHTENPPSGNPPSGKPVDGKSDTTKYLKELSTNKPNTNNTKSNSSREFAKPAKYADDSRYMSLAKRLYDHIKERNPKQKEPNWQTWADDFRKTIELDKRDFKEAVLVLDWCQRNEFWQNNILSPVKFRKQYDQLFLKMDSEQQKTQGKDWENWDFFG